ncbi:unnamed protein product [Rhizoctonia solani]|uniref:Epoxide hydrolase N-terminal domain-containing protein n=1 Tax=Rhizoctonia solani TaxID=456999 RepID=A0A8H3ABC2_9AGAM|nr:unnamed protein product [Rhizoctonia solani]
MRTFHTTTTLLSLLALPSIILGYDVKPFKFNLSSRLPHLQELVKLTKLPETSVLGNAGAGTDLTWLKDRQKDWINGYDWNEEQAAMNKFNHSTVDIGNMTVHFIHQRSSDPNAIPLLLSHGWPGSFYEFNQVIGPLSNPEGKSNTSFHVVVPSLPGFGFTSPAPPGWTLNDTADVFNTLLTDVLGYQSYTAAGGDWGCLVTWALHNNHADHVKAVLYTGLIPQMAPTYDDLKADPRFADKVDSLSEEQKQRLRDNIIFITDGFGYFIEQSTQPATIGLALYDNPVGQLSWLSQLYLLGDPLQGTPPSTLNNNTILTSVSLYYLARTFETSVNTYYQNPGEFWYSMRHAANRVPMGFAEYLYEYVYYPEFYLGEVGNLVFHSVHDRGGHFSALDNPPAYIDDIRTMMGRWYSSESTSCLYDDLFLGL